jgi:hypothetical protein
MHIGACVKLVSLIKKGITTGITDAANRHDIDAVLVVAVVRRPIFISFVQKTNSCYGLALETGGTERMMPVALRTDRFSIYSSALLVTLPLLIEAQLSLTATATTATTSTSTACNTLRGKSTL